MRRLIYLSSATVPMTNEGLEVILADSRRWNEEHGITGLLLYHDGAFLQCLEGEHAEIDVTFSRIERASQHRGLIRAIDERAAERRLFPDWAMGFRSPTDPSVNAGFVEITQTGRRLAGPASADRELSVMIKTFFAGFRDLSAPAGFAAEAARP